jgi:hypothetical protein
MKKANAGIEIVVHYAIAPVPPLRQNYGNTFVGHHAKEAAGENQKAMSKSTLADG